VETAVRRACVRADRLARQRREDAKAEAEGRPPAAVPKSVPPAERLFPHWHPHQLRHSHATEVRKRYGHPGVCGAGDGNGVAADEAVAVPDKDGVG
jgi:hypothetical protein